MPVEVLPLFPTPSSLHNWNRLIQACARDGFFSQALHLYTSMLKSGFHGDAFTFPFVAKSCASLGLLKDGSKLHGHIVLSGFRSNVFVQTSLVDMYTKCCNLSDARKVFDEMRERNLVSWNCMIAGYCNGYRTKKAIKLLNEMCQAGIRPNSSTIVSLISGCRDSVLDLNNGFSVYGYVIKHGFDSDLKVRNSVLTMWIRFGLIEDAHILFNEMKEKSIVTWTAMVSGYVKIGDYNEAFNLFNNMVRVGCKPDSVSLLNLTSAGLRLGNLLVCRSIHALVTQLGFHAKLDIVALLVNLYAKCGDLLSAQVMFSLVRKRDIILWTSMLSGYVQADHSNEALSLFQSLLKSNIKPNHVTVSTILSACADIGSIEIGTMIEEYVRENGFASDLRVQTGLINMHCKCGNIKKAREIFDIILNKDLTAWSTMLNGYARHGRGEETLDLFNMMLTENKVKPDGVVFTSVLSACSHSGLLDAGIRWFKIMQIEYGIEPTIEHFMCMVDMLSKSGHLSLALKFINQIPLQLRSQFWAPVFCALRESSDARFEEVVSKQVEKMEIKDGGNFVLMANLKSSMGKWKEATACRGLITEKGLIKDPGWSRIELSI